MLHLQVVAVGFDIAGSKSLWADLPSSMSAWQLPRQFAIVLRFGWKERALVERLSGRLIGQGSGLPRLVFRAFGGQVSTSL
ncbi:hypothetical protein [Vibrio parahaemolyticus]|uniref:hypothetical protein n=1 Tax=Vibrio parahaemolyticus TaxID=670 RepID=UPI0032016B7E